MFDLPIGRLAQAIGISLVALLVACKPAKEADRAPAAVEVVFLTRGDAAKDSYFQRFSAALKKLYLRAPDQVRVVALSMPADPADIPAALQRAAARQPMLFVAQNGTLARQVRQAAPHARLVFSSRADPVELGLITHPVTRSEPATGLSIQDRLNAKRLEMLLDAYPTLRSVAALGDAEWLASLAEERADMERVAAGRGVTLQVLSATSVEAALALVDVPAHASIQAWCLPRTTLTLDARLGQHITALGKPVMAAYTPDVYTFAHLSYAYDSDFVAPALAELVARVAGGEAPQDIPIQTPQRFQLAVRIPTDPRFPPLNADVVRRADLVLRP